MDTLSSRQVLELIRSGRAQTQAELCQITGARSSTMSAILKRLRDSGVVQSIGTRIQGRGKPPTILRFAPPGHLLGIDLDGSQAEVGVMTFSGAVVAQDTVEYGPDPRPDFVLRKLERVARRLVERSQLEWRELRAMGLSVNGYVSGEGIVEFSTVLPWRNVPITALAREIFGLDLYCCDGRARAVAEYRYGAGQGNEVMLYFNVADGVSARAVVNGQLFAGGNRRSGEIGHIVVAPYGPVCGCGQRGCLEAVISGPAIARRIVADAEGVLDKQPEIVRLVKLASAGRAAKAVEELVRLAEDRQVAYAQRLIDEVIMLAGKALASLAACFDPDCTVVEGYVFRDHPALLRRLWQAANASFRPDGVEMVKLTQAMLGPRGKLLALVAYVGDSLALSGKLTG